MRVNNEPVFVHQDGKTEEYIPKKLETARDAYSVSLHMLFKHVADFHLCIIEIISEKTGLSHDEILNTVLEDPRYKDMFVHPVLNSFGYVGTHDVAKIVPEVTEVKKHAVDLMIQTEKKTEDTTEEKVVKTKTVTKKIATKKTVVKKTETSVAEPVKASEKPTRCRLCERAVGVGDHRECFFEGNENGLWENEEEWVRDCEVWYEECVAKEEAKKLAETTAALAAATLEETPKKKTIVRRKTKAAA